jgi:uncharacterized membrane protein
MKAFRTAALGVVVLAGAGVAAASAASSGGQGAQIIHAVRTTEQQETLDLGQPGTSLGDEQAFTARFEVDGEAVGFDGGTCTLVRLPQVYQCIATNSLPDGLLTAQGLVDFQQATAPVRFAITGGTERYRTAHGSVSVRFGPQHDDVTFRIITRAGDRH